MNTIFAQSSAKGRAGVTVFRISGPNSMPVLKLITEVSSMSPRALYLRELKAGDLLIDRAMVVYFKAPHSFTGEDVVELHCHGSIAIASLLTEALLSTKLVRLAEPGEFARRAFLNGKMDLTSAEGLADLIEAETIMQHKQAMRQMNGELEKLYSDFRARLLKIISLLEAYIDFPDEDIPASTLSLVMNEINDLKVALNLHLSDNRRGERLRHGLTLAILGKPNVGKSSLLNFLSMREVAIVSSTPGTTRDLIETHLDIGGYPIILTDTAGIRDTDDPIEQEGVRRALKKASEADIKIIMFDARSGEIEDDLLKLVDENTILVANKIDLAEHTSPHLAISVKHQINLDLLLLRIEELAAKISCPTPYPSITRERHRHHINEALSALMQCDVHGDLVLATEDIRIAIRYLSLLTGKIEVEEILGEIFANFCIGK